MLSRDFSEASVTLYLWRKGFQPAVGGCSPLTVVELTGKWLAINKTIFPHWRKLCPITLCLSVSLEMHLSLSVRFCSQLTLWLENGDGEAKVRV